MDEPKVICLKHKKQEFDKRRCRHMEILINPELAEVECEKCGERLNPIDVLSRFAHEEHRLGQRIKAAKEELERLSKRVRTKCDHCGRMTTIRCR